MSLAAEIKEAHQRIGEIRRELVLCSDGRRKRLLRADITDLELTIQRAERWLATTDTEVQNDLANPNPHNQ